MPPSVINWNNQLCHLVSIIGITVHKQAIKHIKQASMNVVRLDLLWFQHLKLRVLGAWNIQFNIHTVGKNCIHNSNQCRIIYSKNLFPHRARTDSTVFENWSVYHKLYLSDFNISRTTQHYHSSGQVQIIFPELFATYSQFLQAKMNSISWDRQRLCKLHKVGNTTQGKLPPWRKITQGF